MERKPFVSDGRELARLHIPGHPISLKNANKIIIVGGRRIVKAIASAEAYQHKAIAALCEQWGSRPPITGPISLMITSCGAWRRESGNVPDASNLYQMPEDLLQSAGIIENDSQVEHHDGSRRVCLCDDCPKRPIYKAGPNKGLRKPNCGAVKKCDMERVLIRIRKAETGGE